MGESTFNEFYAKANAETGLQIGLFKAISKVESDFTAHFKTASEPRKYGVMGLTEYAVKCVAAASKQDFGTVGVSDLLDPEANIRLGAKILRFLYWILPNPAMMDVIAEYGKLTGVVNLSKYVREVWAAYHDYSQRAGEPHSILPNEVKGVDIRKPETEEVWR